MKSNLPKAQAPMLEPFDIHAACVDFNMKATWTNTRHEFLDARGVHGCALGRKLFGHK